MRPKLTILAIGLVAATQVACDRHKDVTETEARDSVAGAPVGKSALSIDTDGFKANIEIPGIAFNGDKMNLDGMMLPKGSMIKGMNIKATERDGRDHGSVIFKFASPVTPSELAEFLVAQADKSEWRAFSRSTALDGAIVLRAIKNGGGKESIEYRLTADGAAATSGIATIVSDGARTTDDRESL